MDDAFVHVMRRDENEAYALVVTPDNSDDADKLALFDLTGAVSTGAGTRVPICTFVDGCIETFSDTTPTPSGAWQASQSHTNKY